MTTIYIAKATRTNVAEQLHSLSTLFNYKVTQATGKKSFIQEGFTLTRLGNTVTVSYKKDGISLEALEEELKKAFEVPNISKTLAYSQAVELLRKHSLKELADKHLTSKALRNHSDYDLIQVVEYLYAIHGDKFSNSMSVLPNFLAACLNSKAKRNKKTEYHQQAFRKQAILLIQSMQSEAYIEELKQEFPAIFEETFGLPTIPETTTIDGIGIPMAWAKSFNTVKVPEYASLKKELESAPFNYNLEVVGK